MSRRSDPIDRARRFCEAFGAAVPICEAPMAGSSSVRRAAAVASAGGVAGFGAYTSSPDAIRAWAAAFRSAAGTAALQINLWVPGPPPRSDATQEAAMRAFLSRWTPGGNFDASPPEPLPDFGSQGRALLEARPRIVSSTMGLFPPAFVDKLKSLDMKWFATVTTPGEAIAAEKAGADAVIAQGMEAGGHRGTFDANADPSSGIGLMSLLPQIADRVSTPIIAAGGIADARGIAASLILGASAVQIGTALLRTPESDTHPAWADGLAAALPEGTCLTRVFSGRVGRALATDFLRDPTMPPPLDFPRQRELTASLRATVDPRTMQAWAGQSASMATTKSAQSLINDWWREAVMLLRA